MPPAAGPDPQILQRPLYRLGNNEDRIEHIKLSAFSHLTKNTEILLY